MDTFLTRCALIFQQYITSEWLSFLELIILSISLLLFFRYFQKIGVFIFITLVILIGNIQVLNMSHFSFANLPLGTIAFSTSFIASNLLNEHFGKNTAKKAVYATFFTQIFLGCMMFLTLGYKPIKESQNFYDATLMLFSPSPRLFLSSLIAYLASQLADLHIFNYLKHRTLFERSNIAIFFAALIDNVIFSLLAFYLLSSNPYPLKQIFFDFILGTYWIRILIGFLETPIIYLSYIVKKND